MNIRNSSVRIARIHGVLLGMTVIAANAIDAPKPATPAAEAAQAPPATVEVTATDETAFYERLQYVTHKRTLVGLGISDEVLKSLGQGAVENAIASLSSQSVNGDRNATIALVRIQHWCSRVGSTQPTDAKAQLGKLVTVLPPERLARVAGVFAAERPYLEKARQGCARAPFDYAGIESRLRAAAQGGDPASTTELAQFVRDPAQREALLQQAADKKYPPAMYALASARVIAVQRGTSTENVGTIRLLLKQAGISLPRAKVDLANCMALGCDGHPADAPTAAAFGVDAAREGEPMAFLSMMRMPWGTRLEPQKILAWQYFGNRLNETGCTGDAYVQNAVFYSQSLGMFEKKLTPALVQQARTQAETLWQDNAQRAQREQGCG